MKMNRLLMATLVSSALLSTNALAADGTITFNGNVVAGACTTIVGAAGISGTPSLNATVTLPTVTVNGLGTTVGTYAGHTPFSISLSGCLAASGLNNVRALFTSSTVDSSDIRVMGNTVSGATGVGIAILDSANNQIDLNGGVLVDPGVALPTGTAAGLTMGYNAAYKVTNAAPTAGLITGVADYTISYF